jgi:hypothetical protein
MSRYIGNYLRVPSSEPQQASAPGIWSINEQLNYQRANVWPPARDPYYNQTVLHLSGDVAGTRETNPVTQPRTFLSDASPNNFLLTPNGDVSARPFNPYMGSNYSAYFDGASDYVSLASSSDFTFGTGDFAVEGWIYPVNWSGGAGVFQIGTSLFPASVSNSLAFGPEATPANSFQIYAKNAQHISAGGYLPNRWYHFALTRVSSTTRLFINGSAIITVSADNTNYTASVLGFGAIYGIGNYYTGYISNVRVIKGSSPYNTDFTPPTTPFAPGTANQGLLAFASNRFIDTNTTTAAKALTVNGDTRITNNSPFVEYDTTSGSGYFDGTGDYLSVPASNITDVAAGQAFTFECWFYTTSTAAQTIIKGAANGFLVDFSNTFIGYGKASVIYIINVTTTIVPNQWNHIVVSRNTSNQSRMWLNGTSIGSSNSDNYSFNNVITYIGQDPTALNYMVGYISNLRFVKGTALYDPTSASNITVSTAPLTPVTNTSLLTLQTRAPANNQGIIDSSPNNFVVTRTGNVAQGSFSPFSAGGWSVHSPTNSYLTTPASQNQLTLGTSDFTIEAWAYTTGDSLACVLWSGAAGSRNGMLIAPSTVWIGSGSTWDIADGVNFGTFVANKWNHICFTRTSTVIRGFLNGILGVVINVSAGTTINADQWNIGRWAGFVTFYHQGYISNVRIVKGSVVSLYETSSTTTGTTIFTPTTTELTAISGTTLLTCQSNRFRDNGPNNFTITPNNTPTIQSFSPFAPTQAYVASQLGSSAYFDGSDYLSIASDQRLSWGTGDYTVEAWIYLTTAQSRIMITSGVGNFAFLTNSSRQLIVGRVGTDELIASELVPLNCWVHIAATRASNTTRIFMNGISVATPTSITTNYGQNTTLIGGDPSNNLVGYMSGFRAIKGTALYTSNFIPPTTPLTSVPGTSLLLNFTNSGIVDATAKNVLETVGNAQISKTQSKWGGGSILFDGTADALRIPDDEKENLRFGAGNFTIEFWAWKSANGSMNYDTVISIGSTGSYNGGFSVELSATRGFCFIYDNVVQIQSNFNPNDSTWNHYAVVRDSSTFALYKNGSRLTTATLTPTLGITGTAYVGSGALTDNSFNGYINDLRVTKGFARYTGTTYTMPAAPFPLA